MNATDWLVVVAGVMAIVWVNWYFLFAGRRGVAARATAGGVQEVEIEVRGGYAPSTVRVRRGSRVRLVFDRQEAAGCSEEVVLPEFGVRRFLPPFERTVIEIEPVAAGTYEFTCGMGMLRGRLVVEA